MAQEAFIVAFALGCGLVLVIPVFIAIILLEYAPFQRKQEPSLICPQCGQPWPVGRGDYEDKDDN